MALLAAEFVQTLNLVVAMHHVCSSQTPSAAALNGHFDILKWVRSVDPPCPWDGMTQFMAVEHGDLDIIKWLRSVNPPCPYNPLTPSFATLTGQKHIADWLNSVDPPNLAKVCRNDCLDIIKWMRRFVANTNCSSHDWILFSHFFERLTRAIKNAMPRPESTIDINHLLDEHINHLLDEHFASADVSDFIAHILQK